MSNLENICCPVCNSKGTITVEINNSIQDEPYFHMLPNKIYCKHCDTEFKQMKLKEDVVEEFSIVNYSQKYKELKNEHEELKQHLKTLKSCYDLVFDDLMYIGVWQCPKCHHFTMKDYVCHECGYDKTEGDEHE